MIKIFENDDFVVDYDKENKRYRVSYFEDYHFKEECWFDEYEEENKTLQQVLNEMEPPTLLKDLSSEEINRIVDEFNKIGCASFTIIPTKEKPIKVSFEDQPEVKTIDCNHIETKKKLHGAEAERIINNIFGTTDIAAYDCSDMTDEEIKSVNPLNGYYNPPFEFDEKSKKIVYKK